MSLYQNFRSLFCLLVKTGLERLEIILRNVLSKEQGFVFGDFAKSLFLTQHVQEFKMVVGWGKGGGGAAPCRPKKNVFDIALYSSPGWAPEQSLKKICFFAISNFLKGSNNAKKVVADVLDM